MTPEPDVQRRPRSWAELRQRVLEQDYLDVSELQRRKHKSHQMRYGIWLAPLTVFLLAPVIIAEGASWLMIVAILLIFYAAIACYLVGARWERRWDELIRDKARQRD
jgi:Flp pilus assembly protein TadB